MTVSNIIVSEKCGQLGNQLILFAHWIAVAEERGISVNNPAFEDYTHMFSAFTNNKCGFYPPGSGKPLLSSFGITNFIARLVRRFRVTNRMVSWTETNGHTPEFDRSGAEIVSKTTSTNLFIFGWRYRDYDLLHKHADIIRKVFAPNSSISAFLDCFKKQLPYPDSKVLCCHIRRGDYKDYCNGNYYYDWSYYSDAIARVRSAFSGQNLNVVVCSDETPSYEFLQSTGAVTGDGAVEHDFFLLTRADYLIGPPSTFSRIAAFLGEVPLHTLDGKSLPDDLVFFDVPAH